MIKTAAIFSVLLVSLAVSAFGQAEDPDPVGFCPAGTTANACVNSFSSGPETIGIGTSSFVMVKNGSGQSNDPWYLLLMLPNYSGAAPTLTSSFAQQSVKNAGDWSTTSTQNSVYDFAAVSVPGIGSHNDGSMNQSNLFGALEKAAFGSTPSFFDVFVYTFTPEFDSWTAYTINVGGSGLPAGTFVAGSGGSNPFSTSFTVAGLVNGDGCSPTVCVGTGGGGTVPEPSSVLLFGTLSLVAITAIRKKVRQ